MASITGPYVLDFTGAQEGFVPVYREAQPNKIAWEEAPTGGGGSGTPGGDPGAVQFNDAGALGGDAGEFVWNNDRQILTVGTATNTLTANAVDNGITRSIIVANDNFPQINLVSTTENGSGAIQLFAVNGTVTAPQPSAAGDILGELNFGGMTTSGFVDSGTAEIVGYADDDAGEFTLKGRLVFQTSNGTNSLEALRINSNQSVLALWGLGPITYFNDPATPMQAPIAAVDQMLLYGAGAAAPTFYFAYSDGSYASPTATPLNAVIGKIQFEGAGTDGTANSVNGQSAIIATNRSSDPDAIVADIDFFTAATELSVRYDGGIVLPHEFANGSDPAAPASGGRLYIVQTGGGKSQLAVRFPSGAAQIIATEP